VRATALFVIASVLVVALFALSTEARERCNGH
jgi:hypothetical protein